MKKVFLSVIIPCYNEEENLKKGVLTEVFNYLKTQKHSWEVIVSDDGSTDQSLDLVKEFIKSKPGFRLLKNKHGGKPWAVWQGIKKSRGELVLFADMDQSTPIKELEKLLPWFEKGFHLVIGSRGLERKGFSLFRRIMSRVFRILRGLFLLPGIKDTQCGFKAFKREAALKIFPKLQFFQEKKEIKGWRVTAFDVELLFIAQKMGYRIKEAEVDWRDRDSAIKGKKKNFLKESKEMAQQILRVKINHCRGKYEN